MLLGRRTNDPMGAGPSDRNQPRRFWGRDRPLRGRPGDPAARLGRLGRT